MGTLPADDLEQVRTEFKRIWGYDSFRAPQAEIITSLLSGRDTLIVLPTAVKYSSR